MARHRAVPARKRLSRWALAGATLFVSLLALTGVAVALTPLPAPTAPQASRVYDIHDRLIGELSTVNRVDVSLDQVPLALRQGIVAVEDARFYQHHGIDPVGIARAAWTDLRAGAVVQGGSTLTQQLAKNLFLSQQRTLARKLEELVLTFKLESHYTKDQILEMYLNTVYFGSGAYGVEAAAETYFNKPVHQLDLAQSALLAGLPQAPGDYSPFDHPQAARQRRNEVLARMADLGYLTPEQAAAAEAKGLELAFGGKLRRHRHAQYFLSYLERELASRYPDLAKDVFAGGYRIYTTLDLNVQEAAERAFANYMVPGSADANGVPQPEGALVALDPRTGGIRALIGGRDYAVTPLNRAIDAHRQPGSTFKAFLYTTVLEQGHTTVERQVSEPVQFPGSSPDQPYVPTDPGPRPYLYRPLTVREALARSENVVATKWMNIVTPQAVIKTARTMGITSDLSPTLPLALGVSTVTPLELARAYAPLANLGWRVDAYAIRRVEDARGRAVVPTGTFGPHAAKVLDSGIAYIMTDLLKSVLSEGTGRNLRPILGDRPAAGKTGSTGTDAWFVGYTPQLVTAVWVGNDDNSQGVGEGAAWAGPVWAHFMTDALANVAPEDWPQPANVLRLAVSADDGLLPNPTSPTVEELFIDGTQPTQVSPLGGSGSTPAKNSGTPSGNPQNGKSPGNFLTDLLNQLKKGKSPRGR